MEKDSLQLEVENKNNVLILKINSPRLDNTKAPELKTEFLRLIAEDSRNILINLKSVESIDSSGLGALLFGLRQVVATNGNLKLVDLQPRVMSLLKIAKLDRIFEIFDDEKTSIESFNT